MGSWHWVGFGMKNWTSLCRFITFVLAITKFKFYLIVNKLNLFALRAKFLLYINLACLSVCLSVCLYPINVKTAEPIGPNFFVGYLGTPGKVYEWSKFQIFVSIKIRSSLNFWKFWKSANYFCFVLRCTQREHVLN